MNDLSHIPTRHDSINLRLEQWARWVRVTPQKWGTQPMFRWARSNARQWETDPVIHETLNTLECHEIERAVYFLPEKHRTAIRWAYCFPNRPATTVRQHLGVTRTGLCEMLNQARDMLKNRISQKIVDTA
jgi:hypothetical protein